MGDLVTFCMPDFSKCGAAAGDVVPNLMEAVEYFTSMRWMNFEETGTKAYVQDPSCIFWHNLPLCLGMVCLPGCGCATLSRTLTKMTDTTCESNCLSCCALSCICCESARPACFSV
ncbi:hypothetical protein FOA52_009245 [Chlamydomonas sp. UWO 241]|nr:hypothetical protein FOA52_009245 [Chlamydomonas sp. UWO 241]